VTFAGVDDKVWRIHTPGNAGGLSPLFVALSRTWLRANFLLCAARGRRVVGCFPGASSRWRLVSQ